MSLLIVLWMLFVSLFMIVFAVMSVVMSMVVFVGVDGVTVCCDSQLMVALLSVMMV